MKQLRLCRLKSIFVLFDFRLKHPSTSKHIEFSVTNGLVNLPKNGEQLSVTIVSQRLPSRVALKKSRGVTKLDIVHVIHYGIKTTTSNEQNQPKADAEEAAAVETMTQLLQHHSFDWTENNDGNSNAAAKFQTHNKFRRQHKHVWSDLWQTGFQISTSLAENVINGDQINATIYAVLSQVRSLETDRSEQSRKDILKSLAYAEGCYDSYHTLQAGNLWKNMDNIHEMNRVVNSWLLTLEKQVRMR